MTTKRVALVAHDNKKSELIQWALSKKEILEKCELYATGTTGKLLEQELQLSIHQLQSGPLGGDQQLGAMISEGKVDVLIFFWDPLEPLPHDPDIRALLRIAVVWNIAFACNKTSADYLFSSPHLSGGYVPVVPDFSTYRNRKIEK